MKGILTLTLIVINHVVSAQTIKTTDSLNIRVLNKGKFYLKEYTLTINGRDYRYEDIWKNKYSDYKQLPFIWPSNRAKTVVIVKRLGYDKWMNVEHMPIDHVGENKLTSGSYTIEIRTRRNKENLEVEEKLTQDNKVN
jgi:hypothetical protein